MERVEVEKNKNSPFFSSSFFSKTKTTQLGPCTMYVGPGGAGNFVKMVHNGIEYGDMQLISEAYDILKTVGASLILSFLLSFLC